MTDVVRVPKKGTPAAFMDRDGGVAFRVNAAPATGFRYTPYTMLYCRELLPDLSKFGGSEPLKFFKSMESYHQKNLRVIDDLEMDSVTKSEQEGLAQAVRGSIFNKMFMATILGSVSPQAAPEDDWMTAKLAGVVLREYGTNMYYMKGSLTDTSLDSICLFAADAAQAIVDHYRESLKVDSAYDVLRALPEIDPREEFLGMTLPGSTEWDNVAIPPGGWYNTDFNPGIEI